MEGRGRFEAGEADGRAVEHDVEDRIGLRAARMRRRLLDARARALERRGAALHVRFYPGLAQCHQSRRVRERRCLRRGACGGDGGGKGCPRRRRRRRLRRRHVAEDQISHEAERGFI